MARKPLLAAVGALIALAAVSANPPHPALPPLPGTSSALPPLPPNSTGVLPVGRGSTGAPPLATPGAPPAAIPVAPPQLHVPLAPPVPSLPAFPQPVAPASPPPSQILEPVSAVNRFAGTYLGGTASRAIVYAEADGKAEVLVYAIGGAKEPFARCAVPVGKLAFGAGRAFVAAPRELSVVGIEGRVEWSFALPGRADNGERFVAVAGFDGANVLLASSDPKEGGRVYSLSAETGKQVAFWKFENGFDANALFAVDAQKRLLIACSGPAARVIQLDVTDQSAVTQHGSAASHLSAASGIAIVGAQSGVLAVARGTVWPLTGDAGTGPAGFAVTPSGTRAFVPTRNGPGGYRLAALTIRGQHNVPQEWSIDVPKAITAPPVTRGASVYFAAGSVLYRASAATGEVYWKHTLALDPNDALTGLAFDGDDLVARGGSVSVRVTDRGEPGVAPAPRESRRQVFTFGPGLFGSQ